MKRKVFLLLLVAALLAVTAVPAFAGKSGTLENGNNKKAFGTEPGFDEWGYNYRAHMFLGDYCDAYRGADWCEAYIGTNLMMKWNEAWLSSSDRDGDDELDRHHGHDSYIGSGAWLTNHMSGVEDGEKWVYFVKIVAKETGDQECEDTGGYEIWGAFCVVQEVESGIGVTTLAEPGLGH